MHVDYVHVRAEPAALDNDILCGICDIRDWKLLLLDYMLHSAGLWFEEKETYVSSNTMVVGIV